MDLNGGTYNGSTANITKNFDNSKEYNGGEQLPVPTKTGYTFLGYGIGANLMSDGASLTDYSHSDSTLKAFYVADDNSLSGDVYQFGNYPKAKVTDASLIQSLATASDTDGDGWLNCNGKEYAKDVYYSSTSYFEVEPLLWKVLDSSTGLLFAMDVIDKQAFSSGPSRTMDGLTLYDNNYKYSNLRAWLNGYDGTSYSVSDYSNGGFLNTAFTATERTKIETTTVDNSPASTGYSSNSYACDNTQAKVFALSYTEATNSSYGLNSATGRIGKATDYAAGSGGYYWLRSPDRSDDDYAWFVYNDGHVSDFGSVDYSGVAVRPASRTNIRSTKRRHQRPTPSHP